MTRPAFLAAAWFSAFLGARGILEATAVHAWLHIAAALPPSPYLVGLVRARRRWT